MSGLDTHLATKGVNNTRAVGSNKTRLGLALQRIHDLQTEDRSAATRESHIMCTHADLIGLWDAFGNADNKPNLGLDSLNDGIGGVRRRNV